MKKQPEIKPTITDHIKRLNFLLVRKQIESATIYDTEINKLKNKIDYFNYGIK